MTIAPVLVVDAVSFRYPAGVRIGPISLACAPGLHRVGGANGTGKSTLLRCLAGDLSPTIGTVRVDGRDPVQEVAARSLIGHAPYPDDLPDFLSVEECLHGLAAFRRRPDWRGDALAETLELPLALRIGAGSAGQRRKAGLLAALVGDPPVLLLDEPWAAIDAAAIAVVTSLIGSLRETRTILFTTHGHCPLAVDSIHVPRATTER